MSPTESLGFLAAVCTTASFVPQVWHILKTRDTRAISLMMYLLFTVGVVLWLVYGIMIGSTPVVAANSITLVLALVILTCKVRWG
jgi:MtN3 and saliva related transmembrane protein